MEEQTFFLLIAITLAFAVGCWGKTKKIGFWMAFGLSILNLLIGIIAVALSKKLSDSEKDTKQSYQ